jgi:hypothetical protein
MECDEERVRADCHRHRFWWASRTLLLGTTCQVGKLFFNFDVGFFHGISHHVPAHDYQPGKSAKKTDMAEYLEALHHIGLLFNEPPGTARLPFI